MSVNHKQILLVDDDEELLLWAVHLFRSAGYRVKAARNAFECEACVEEETPDLVLMDDVWMPELGGLRATYVLRERPDMRRAPIILYSGQPEERIRLLMEEVGATAFIRKPCEPHTLLECVENFLSNSMPIQRREVRPVREDTAL